VIADGQPVDEVSAAFGIREARFEAASGFWLNGQNLKLKGVCLHHDGGAVGAAVPLGVWERRLRRLKALGVNAVRTAHNPPDPGFLDLTDRLGLLVMDEVWDAWTVGKNHANYGVHLLFPEWWEADTRDTVPARPQPPERGALERRQRDPRHAVSRPREAHPARACSTSSTRTTRRGPSPRASSVRTSARTTRTASRTCSTWSARTTARRSSVAAHEQKPTRKVIGTENRHDREVWLSLRDHPFVAGQFLWPGIDYLGEEDWPRTTFVRGLLDRTGEPRAAGWERASWWSDAPVVRAFRPAGSPAASGGGSGIRPAGAASPAAGADPARGLDPRRRGPARRGRRGLLERGRGRADAERTQRRHPAAPRGRVAAGLPRSVRARDAEGDRAEPRPRGGDARAAHGRTRARGSR
jgi:beta-galactosidase